VRVSKIHSGDRAPSMLQTADRALQVLQQFASPGEALTVTEVAERLGLNRSTASRLVGTLAARGFLERSAPHELVRLGPELARLGRIALAGRELVSVAKPLMDRLASRTGETVTLGMPAGDQVLNAAQSDGRHFVSSGRWVGLHAPPHCCSDGKVLLAFGALEVPDGRLARLASNTITDRRALVREIERVRRNGFALVDSEMEDGLVGVAVPIREGDQCVAALCVSGPTYRLHRDAVAAYVAKCRQTAAEIERALGGAGHVSLIGEEEEA
jgi:IclR family acetate operon transcriptional repressor